MQKCDSLSEVETVHHVLLALPLMLFLFAPAQAKENVTLLVQFEGKHSQESVDAMKKELGNLMKDLEVDWRSLDDIKEGETFPELVVVKFKGVCQMETIDPHLFDERGPLAFTYTTEGHVLPFSEVECEKVRLTIRSAMRGDDFKQADTLLGRALGRVLAHELYHVLGHTRKHEKDGVNQKGLTAQQLIAEHMH